MHKFQREKKIFVNYFSQSEKKFNNRQWRFHNEGKIRRQYVKSVQDYPEEHDNAHQ